MYLFYNKDGVLKEIINDDALRQYDYGEAYKIYLYLADTTIGQGGVLSISYRFEKANGDVTSSQSTTTTETKQIPIDRNRDLKFFEYGKDYTMYVVEIPAGEELYTANDSVTLNENVFEFSGDIACTFTAITSAGGEVLGKFVFTVEDSVPLPTEQVTVSEYEYLLTKFGQYTGTMSTHIANTSNPHQVTKAQVGLGNVDNTSDLNKPISTATQDALNTKVDKVVGKGLSTNDFTNADKSNLDANTSARHTHDNKALLDTYTNTNSDMSSAVSLKHSHNNKELLDTYTQTETNLADAVSKKHTHTNKELLDTYSNTNANISDAIDKKHSHSNKALLDTYTQTESDLASAVSLKHTHTNKSVLDATTVAFTDSSYVHTDNNFTDIYKNKIDTNASDIDAIESKIPEQASSFNQLADKSFVNSSIATETAYFKGTLDATTDLGLTKPASHSDIVTALGNHTFSPAPTNNDYCFVVNKDSNENVIYDRFKYSSNAWLYEYSLNNSSFTATQWAAINSGINSTTLTGLVNDEHTHSNKALLDTYNQTNADITDAIDKKHSHSNKSILDATTASYTTAEKTKLSGIADGAEVNVQSDWNATSGDALILNKPSIPVDANLVHKSGDELIYGVKSFVERPLSARLPSTYQEVEYIESSNAQVIDTGFKPKNNTSIDISYKYLSFTNATKFIYGANNSAWSVKSYGLTTYSTYQSYYAYANSDETLTIGAEANTNYRANRVGNIIDIYKNDELIKNKTLSSSEFECDYNLYLFACNWGGTKTHFSDIRVYSCEIKDNGTLVRNFIPCYRKSDNEIGLYDTVNNVFYTNQGTGTFSKGADVVSGEFVVDSDLSTVATSGNYNDLSNKPTSLSQFTDNLGSSPVHTHSQYLTSHQTLKTVNGNSIVGSGDLVLFTTATDSDYTAYMEA